MSRGRVNCTTAQVIRPLFIGHQCLRNRLGRNAHYLVRAHKLTSQVNRHVALPHMDSLRTDRERHIHTVIDD